MTAGYDFWLVDLDGTLVDVEPAYLQGVMGEVGERIGHRFTPEQAQRVWRGLGASPEEHLRRWGVDPQTFWRTFHEVENPHARAAATYLYPDARVVERLDCPVGLVTHCQQYLTAPVLARLEMRDWFDAVVCCHDEVGWKPDPRPVELAMEQLGVDGEATGVLVGDSVSDVRAAWNAGLDGVHLERNGAARGGPPVRADAHVTSIEELLDRQRQ